MMKNILIVCAMEEERQGILRHFEEIKEENDGVKQVFFQGKTLSVMLGGIGKVSMAFRLGKYLASHKVDLVINVGVAGSCSKELPPFSTLIATKCAYYDVDLTAFSHPRGEMSECPLYFECDSNILKIISSFQDKTLKEGLILSGDCFVTKKNFPKGIEKDFDHPLAIDMESAAVGQVCHIAQIPFLVIRSISDDTTNENGNESQYEQNMSDAAKKAGDIVVKLIEKI